MKFALPNRLPSPSAVGLVPRGWATFIFAGSGSSFVFSLSETLALTIPPFFARISSLCVLAFPSRCGFFRHVASPTEFRFSVRGLESGCSSLFLSCHEFPILVDPFVIRAVEQRVLFPLNEFDCCLFFSRVRVRALEL